MIVADPARPGVIARVVGWARHHMPTRESVHANRLLRPIAHLVLAPSLWHFNRRSVPRGVALGLSTSVLVPVAHMPVAAVLSVPLRANLPTAVGITIPSTFLIPGIWWGAYQIGHRILHIDHSVGHQIASNVKANAGWLHWLFAQAGPATIIGLLVIATVLGSTGYFATSFAWRLRIARKWRRRHLPKAN
ncbi:MAG: DUF2062 domain-containing protein [Pseudomonadota bacterium]|nr:DUF2062 domain-containing protein [Pseudomonadota bacterium]